MPLQTPKRVPDSFWDEVALGAPRVWFITCVAALVGSALAIGGDWTNLPPDRRWWGLALRCGSILYFAIGLFLASRSPECVRKHYQGLMLGVFPAVAIPVSLNGHWAGAHGNLYWFGILQLQLGASTFFLIPAPLFLIGAWLSNLLYLVIRLGFPTRPLDNDDANVVIGLVIFGILASFTHHVILLSRRQNHEQRRQLWLQHEQKAEILSSITDAFFALDREWRVVFMNAAAENIMSVLRPAGSLLSKRLWDEFPGLHDSLMHREFHRAVLTQEPVCYEEYYPLLDREVEVKAFPARDGLAVYFHDVTDLKRTQQALEEAKQGLEERVRDRTARLATSVAEKEVLLREVHHRSKNNMQVLSSLMRLQASALENPQARLAFRESEHRIRAMALVHERLYQSDDLSRVDLRAYLTQLVNQLVQAYATRRVQTVVEVEDLHLAIDTAVPCGLITNELVANAVRHAFAQTDEPRVQVTLHALKLGDKPGVELAVIDNGCGLPEGFDPSRTTSLGFHLVSALGVNQLGGTLTIGKPSIGADVRIWFPLASEAT